MHLKGLFKEGEKYMYDVDKLREYFPSTTVFKDPSVMSMFKAAKIEAFLRDWILKRRTGTDGSVDNVDA
jgi:ATP-dependent Lon protease